MSGGNKTTGSTTQTQGLNPAFQPVVEDLVKRAGDQSKNPLSYYPKTTVSPFSNQTVGGLTGIQNLATAGDPLGNKAYQGALGLIGSNGLTSDMKSALSPLQNISTGTSKVQDPGFKWLANRSIHAGDRYGLEGIAAGNYLDNPHYKAALQDTLDDTKDQINRNFSMSGRYASGAHSGVLADELGGLSVQAMSDNWNRERALQNAAQQFLSSDDRQGINQAMGAYGSLAGLQATNIANQGGAAGQLANIYGQGVNNSMNLMSMSPGLYDNTFSPYQKLMGVGQTYDNQNQSILNDAISRHDFNQTKGREPLNWLSSLLSGTPGSGLGTSVTTQQRPSGGVQGALGGALGGATLGSSLGTWGALGGGVLGGLAGLF